MSLCAVICYLLVFGVLIDCSLSVFEVCWSVSGCLLIVYYFGCLVVSDGFVFEHGCCFDCCCVF